MLLKDLIKELQEIYDRDTKDLDYYAFMGEPVVYTDHYKPDPSLYHKFTYSGFGDLQIIREVDGSVVIIQKDKV